MTTPYRHLLCPVDFSDVSRAALEWALSFSAEVNARLSVLHVIDTGLMSIGNLVAVPDALGELRQRAEERMRAWERELDLDRAATRIVEGVPSEVIVETSKTLESDLLVMGTHGFSGFQKLILGSVTEKVLHRARIPMLILSPEAERERKAARPQKILAAVDLGPETAAVLRHGLWLAEHYRASLVAAHIVSVPYVVLSDRTVEQLTPDQLEQVKASLTEERKRELQALLPESPRIEIELAVTVGAPFAALRDLVAGAGVDFAVMGAGGHGETSLLWLGSTCHKMARSAPCPVLIVR